MVGSLTRVQQLAVLLHLFEKGVDGEVRLLEEEVYEGIVGGGRRGSFLWGDWFQTVWLDEKIDGFAVHAQKFDQPVNLLALVGGGLEELDTHAKFRVGEADDANRALRRAGWTDRKNHAGGYWERRTGLEIAARGAEVGEAANDGRVVSDRLGKLAIEPFTECAALVRGEIFETDASLVFAGFPSHFPPNFELVVETGQLEGETDDAFPGFAAGKLYGHAAFADVERHGLKAGRSEALDRDLHRNAQLQAALALHKGANRAEAGFGAFDG